jgi:YidC/Oxa1 family membrane protein insertase
MSFLTLIFNKALYQPLFNGLIFLYNIIPLHDFGVAIILLTIIIRLALYPLNQKAITSQKALGELQPQIKEIQNKYKGDQFKQSQSLMEIYKKNKINPASGCLPLLIQLPILLALYRVFWTGLDPQSLNMVYSFISRPEHINPMFLGFINLAQSNYVMAILAGIFTFFQSKMMMVKQPAKIKTSDGQPDIASIMNKQMVYFMPLFTVFIAWKLPAGLALYWIVITLLGIGQQYLIIRKNNGRKPDKN